MEDLFNLKIPVFIDDFLKEISPYLCPLPCLFTPFWVALLTGAFEQWF